jgi:hypothetical protein
VGRGAKRYAKSKRRKLGRHQSFHQPLQVNPEAHDHSSDPRLSGPGFFAPRLLFVGTLFVGLTRGVNLLFFATRWLVTHFKLTLSFTFIIIGIFGHFITTTGGKDGTGGDGAHGDELGQ